MKNYEFPKEIGEAWINALKSGQYRQGQGTLCKINNDSKPCYCVMGVLGKCAGVEDRDLIDRCFLSDIPNNQQLTKLFQYLLVPIKIDDDSINLLQIFLIRQNDIVFGSWTFQEFAEWLENNLELV